jgi:hypothetical protein
MLTPKERQRIEDEERRRHAEAQYRTEVRAKLQPVAPPPMPDAPAPVKSSNSVASIIGIAAVLGIAFFIISNPFSSSRAKNRDDGRAVAHAASAPAPLSVPKTQYVPVSKKIATGQILVKARGYVQYRITIEPEMVEPVLTGSFNASGGSGNDITAVIADEMNYTNWINGHQARVFWGTEGKQTTGTFKVRLRPGQYYLAFSNKFSAFADKQVFLEVDLNSKRAQTYY